MITQADLSKGYDFLYQSPLCDLETIQVMGIAEDHMDIAYRKHYCKSIDKIAETYKQVIVLVEGVVAMKELSPLEHPQTCFIKNKNVKIIAWDAHNLEDRYADLPDVIEIPKLVLEYQLKMIEEEIETNSERKVELKLEIAGLVKACAHKHKNMDMKAYEEMVGRCFPERTVSMVSTIKKIKEKFSDAFIIILAGRAHFKTHNDDSRYDLSLLYESLNLIPSVVVEKKDSCVIM